MFFRDAQLRLLAERDDAKMSGKPASEIARSGIGRVELRDILLDGLTDPGSPVVHWKKQFTHFSHLDNNGVRAHFADGTFEDGDLLVGADGPRSKIRQQYLPEIQRLDLGILTIAGRYILNEARVRSLPAEITNGSLNNVVPQQKGWMFVSTWTSRSPSSEKPQSQSERYVMWAYVVPQEDTPPNAEQLSVVELQNLVLGAIWDWSPQLSTIVQDSDTSTIRSVPLRSMPFLQPWEASNVTVLGDAIHNMTPMAGVGANTALRDAELLARMLKDVVAGKSNLVEAISSYENEMRHYANEAVGLSRRNAEGASNSSGFQRWIFRTMLRAAQASPTIMRATLGRSVVKAH